MKLFIFLAMSGLLSALPSQAAELSTFDEVRAQYRSYKDPTRLSYLYNRCAALELNVSALMQRKGQQQGAKDFEDRKSVV